MASVQAKYWSCMASVHLLRSMNQRPGWLDHKDFRQLIYGGRSLSSLYNQHLMGGSFSDLFNRAIEADMEASK